MLRLSIYLLTLCVTVQHSCTPVSDDVVHFNSKYVPDVSKIVQALNTLRGEVFHDIHKDECFGVDPDACRNVVSNNIQINTLRCYNDVVL